MIAGEPQESDLRFDESQLGGDAGEVYVFQWLCSVERAIKHFPLEDIKPHFAELEATFLMIALAKDSHTAPGRPVRNLLAKCYVSLYGKGDTRTMFDTINSFLKFAADAKIIDKDSSKVAAFYCVGEIMEEYGSQIMSFMAELATVAVKTHRMSSASVLLRFHAVLALRKAVPSAGRALTDAAAKDIIKHMRYALSDKALPIRRAAAELLVEMYPKNGTHTVADIEQILTSCIKSLETADEPTRKSLALLVAHLVSSTQVERKVIVVETTKKGKKDDATADDDTAGPGAAATTEITKPLLGVAEMFTLLSTTFNKPSTARKPRIGIIEFYAALLVDLGPQFVENNYAAIVRHFLVDIVPHPRNATTRYEVLLVRKMVGVLLRDLIGVRMLSEQSQIAAIQELSSSYLRKWPALIPGKTAPDAKVLVVALKEVAGLLQQFGNAPPPVQEALSEPLISLLAHPTHSVRVAAAWALRCFSYSTPLRLPKLVLSVMEMLQRDITTLSTPGSPPDIKGRALGHAYGLAGLFAVIPERPLYVSYDLCAKVFDNAVGMLKKAADHDLGVAAAEVEVGWTCISSLMSLGPNFVRAHLPQLLVLWRNALPKPTSKDTTSGTGRTPGEWMFLLHVRDCALGAILCFLRHNSPALVTLDVARRVASLLSNALAFANAFTSQHKEELAEQPTPANAPSTSSPELSLATREALLRRRVYQCFSALGFASQTEIMQQGLLQSVIALFGSFEGYAGSFVQAAIASSAGTFTSVWNVADGYGYGVSSLDISSDVTGRNRDTIDRAIDDLITRPVIGSCEHDPLVLCRTRAFDSEAMWPEPSPAATSVVDAAIELFSHLLLLQDPQSAAKTIGLLIESVQSPKLERNVGRKAAVFVNAVFSILMTLRLASGGNVRQAREVLGNSQVSGSLGDFLKDAILSEDVRLRIAGSEALGRLANISNTTFLGTQINSLVEQVVNNRDPNARAGCALAFGAVYTHAGGLAAQPYLKTVLNVLMSLGNDPHPVVHYWALHALGDIVSSSSLSYSPFIPNTLGMLFKVYVMESHEPEGGLLGNVNLAGELPTFQVVCRIIGGVISTLGPELQETGRTRGLILDLVSQFASEIDDGVIVEAIHCIQHCLMFAPNLMDVPDLVKRFRSYLSSSKRTLKLASINALYQLVQKDAFTMSRIGGDRLVEVLFGMLDDDSSVEGVRSVITSWLQQTVTAGPSGWIDLCQRIMARITASQQATEAVKNSTFQDDESQSLSQGMQTSGRGHVTARWRTQLFALQCLHSICTTIAKSGRREHFDIPYARVQGVALQGLLVQRVPDLIRMAFTASAAYVTEIRLEGLVVLRDVIEIFSQSPDPDYPEALLLEQHQAPITAALTPAFSSDSTPEILASAVQVCAVFVGCGVVKDVSRMGRILKLLTSALEQSKSSGMLAIGDVEQLSPNASVMLRIATLTAWAELEIAGAMQAYLQEVLKPQRATLVTLWVSSLRDYATIRGDSEVLQETASAGMDTISMSLGKEVLLPYYNESWSRILKAVSITMQRHEPYILAAMDGREANDTIPTTSGDDPTSFFYVVFGLVYEALAQSSADSASAVATRDVTITALQALASLVKPEYSGSAILEPTIFEEFSNLCYRLAMTEPPEVQVHLVAAVSSFVNSQCRRTSTTSQPKLSELPHDSPINQCLRITAHILKQAIPSSRETLSGPPSEARIQVLNVSFSTLTNIGDVLGAASREDIRAVSIALYADLLKNEFSIVDLIGPTLPALKLMLDNPPAGADSVDPSYTKLVHGLLSSCLQNVDECSGRSGTVVDLKTKNNLLAAVLVLTVTPATMRISKAALEQCAYLISQKLGESPEVALSSAHCAKTLITASLSSSNNPGLRHCSGLLLPALITFTVNAGAYVNDGSHLALQLPALDEVLKAFNNFFAGVPEASRALVLAVLLPTVAVLLDPTQVPLNPAHDKAISLVLVWATATPVAFKEVMERLDEGVREVLEGSVRLAVTGGRSQTLAAQPSAKKQISLKAF